ncbi:MAG: glycosyltransferase family 4 protein [Syntrophomonadaceae bacterium]
MRIGFFTDSYKPYTSGVVTSITTFQEELTKFGHEIYIFAPNYQNYFEVEENVYRFYSLPAPTNPDFSLAIPLYPGISTLIKKLNLDIIHVHSPFTMGRVGLRFARKYQIPLVFTYHTRYDQYVHYVPIAHDLAKGVTIKYSTRFCNACDHIIVPSSNIERLLKAYDINSPISVIPTGVPIHRFNQGDSDWLRKHYQIPRSNKILLFVGRLTKEKNLEFLIKAFHLIKLSLPNTTLVITAQGPMENELKKLVFNLGLSLDRDVIFTGAVPFDNLVNIYYSADLFVFSSLTETQGLVLIEAMATGLPVVAIRACGVEDMVEDNQEGILTSNDLSEFSQSVCRVLTDNHLYETFKNNALIKACRLSSSNTAKKLESVYIKLATTNRPKPQNPILNLIGHRDFSGPSKMLL